MHKYETLPAERKLLKKYIKIQKAAPLNQIIPVSFFIKSIDLFV